MFGYNDYRYNGDDTTGAWTFRNSIYGAMGWMLTRDTLKDFARRDAADYSFVGTWADASVGAYPVKCTSTQNDSLIYNFSGPVVYFASWLSADSGAVYTVAVDGVVKETVHGKKYLSPYIAKPFGPSFVRVAGLTNAAHVLSVKKTDANGTYLWAHWAGVPTKGPNLIMCHAIKSNAYGYSLGISFNKGADSLADWYNAMMDTAVTAFTADGYDVWGIASDVLIDVHADLLADSIHIDDTGHGKIYQAIMDSIRNWSIK